MRFAERGGVARVGEGVGGRGETAFVGLAGDDVGRGIACEGWGEEVEEGCDG